MNYESIITAIRDGHCQYVENKGVVPEVVIMNPEIRAFLVKNIKEDYPFFHVALRKNKEDEYIMGMLIRASWCIQENMLVFAPMFDFEFNVIEYPEENIPYKNTVYEAIQNSILKP